MIKKNEESKAFHYKIFVKFDLLKEGDICLDTISNNNSDIDIIIKILDDLEFLNFFEIKTFKLISSKKYKFEYKIIIESKIQKNLKTSLLIEVIDYSKLRSKK